MRRTNAFTRSRTLPVLTAAFIGYLIGGWHPATLRAAGDASAADTVALRFPVAWDTASAAAPAVTASAAAPVAATDDAVPDSGVLPDPEAATAAPANSLNDAQLALLDPAPMVPQPRPQAKQVLQDSAPQPEVQLASAEVAVPASAGESNAVRRPRPPPPMPARVRRPVKIPAVAVQRRPMNRPGYMLDDAQIASIRQRLHLTPDQQQMWPAVETALRNIAYTRAQQARRGAGIVQAGDIDPESVENLKSAAVPLIMSFDDDQKQQVRDLAHVMGLDQLASEF